MKRVLAVDDDPWILQGLTLVLEGAYELETAVDGADALGVLARSTFDLVLLDLMMPMVDGADVVRGMIARGDATPVLLMSASPDLAEQARALGVAAYLPKPFSIDLLETRIARTLGAHARPSGVSLRVGEPPVSTGTFLRTGVEVPSAPELPDAAVATRRR